MPVPSNRGAGASEGTCAADEKKPESACEHIKSHLRYRIAFKDEDACGVDEEADSVAETHRLVENHIDYSSDLEAENIAVPEECCRCFEQLLKNSKSVKKSDEGWPRSPLGRRNVAGANNSCSQSAVCEDDARSSQSSSNNSKKRVKVTVKEVCENHKRFLARTADLLNRLKTAGSKEKCEVCQLVKELYDTGFRENSAFSLRFEDTAIPPDLLEGGVEAPNQSLKPETNRYESCAKAALLTANVTHCIEKKCPTAADEMSKHRCDYDDADDRKALGGPRAAGKSRTVCYRCEFHHSEHTDDGDDNDDADAPSHRKDERTRWPPDRKRKEPRPPIDVCSKCGGEMEADEPKDEYLRRPNSRADISPAASDQKFSKRTRNQRDSSVGQQKPLRETSKMIVCTCTEEDEAVPSTRSLDKSNSRCCEICGGVTEVEENVSPRRSVKRSEAEMNEAIMAKRAEVWGENVPPDFIINDTDYAKRHADCCVRNTGAVRNARYKCPKGGKPADTGEEEDADKNDELGYPKIGFSMECVFNRSAEKKPSKSQERRCNRPPSDRPSNEKCRPKSPAKRQDLQRSRKNTGDSSAPIAQREGADSSKGQNKDQPEVRLTAIDSNGSVVSYTCKPTKSDEEAWDEDAMWDHGTSCDPKSTSWFEKLNQQIRSYMDINYDSDEELVVCQEPSSDDPRSDPQSPVITWVLTLPPRHASKNKTQGSKDSSTRSRHSLQDDARCARDKQAPKPAAPSGANDPLRGQQCKQTQTSESMGSAWTNPSRISFEDKVQTDSGSPAKVASCTCAKNRENGPETTGRAEPDMASSKPAPPPDTDNYAPEATTSGSQTGIVLSVETARHDGSDKEEDNSRISIRISSLKRTSQDNDADGPASSPEQPDAEPPHKQTQTSISVRRRQHSPSNDPPSNDEQ